MAHDAVVDQPAHRSELILARHFGIYPMKLPQPDLRDAKLIATLDRLFAQVSRIAVHLPDPGAGPLESRLGGDQQAVIRVERLADQHLGNVGSVGVGGVDEVDMERRQPFQDTDSLRAIVRFAPYAGARDPHGAEAEAIDRDFAADRKRPRPARV